MKGFKSTGNGPSYGNHAFKKEHGYTGSTGKVQSVRGFTRGVPKFAKGGAVGAENGNAVMLRSKPVSEFDKQYGGKTPLQSKFAHGGMASGGKNFIQKAIKHPGALRAALHAKPGQPIPAKKLEKATHSSNPTMRKRAVLAETLKGMHKAEGGKVGNAMAAMKTVKSLMDKGVDATKAASQAATTHGMDLQSIKDSMAKKGMQPDPGFLGYKKGGRPMAAKRGGAMAFSKPMIKSC